jgi:hypothetical protein
LNGQDAGGGATVLYSPQYAAGGGWRSSLSIVNLDGESGLVTLAFFDRDGEPAGSVRTVAIRGWGKIQIDAQDFFAGGEAGPREGYVVISSDGPRLTGSVSFGDEDGSRLATALPLVAHLESQVYFSQIASDANWYTGLAVVNPGSLATMVKAEVFDSGGGLLGQRELVLEAGAAMSRLLWQYVPDLAPLRISSGYVRLTSGLPVASFAVYGSANALSALPPQLLR